MKRTNNTIRCICMLLLVSTRISAQVAFIDQSFGYWGTVVHNFYGKNYCHAGIMQPDGKLVLVGTADETSYALQNFAISRYTIDGMIDSTFSNDGIDSVDLNNYLDEARHAALDTLGRIVVTGRSSDLNGNKYVGMVRYNPDGTYDNSFSGDGKVSHQMSSSLVEPWAILVKGDGKIAVAGRLYSNSSSNDVFIMQFNDNGTPDNTFGASGLASPGVAGSQSCLSMVEQPDGKLIVAGNNQTFTGGAFGYLIMRFNSNGTLDSTFNGDGIMVDTLAGINISGMALLPDGRIIVGGDCSHLPDSHFALARYLDDGVRDSTFGTSGQVETVIGTGTGSSVITDIRLQADGKILATGYFSGDALVYLARYNTDGTIDNSFGVNGIIGTGIGTSTNRSNAVLIQPNGKIVLTAWSAVINGTLLDIDFSMIRYGLNVNTGDVETNLSNNVVQVYPNPVVQTTTITWSNSNFSNNTFSLYDVTGRLLECRQITENSITIDFSDQRQGIYFFTVSDEITGNIRSGKIVKN